MQYGGTRALAQAVPLVVRHTPARKIRGAVSIFLVLFACLLWAAPSYAAQRSNSVSPIVNSEHFVLPTAGEYSYEVAQLFGFPPGIFSNKPAIDPAGGSGGSPPAIGCNIASSTTTVALTGCAANSLIIVEIDSNQGTTYTASGGSLTWTCLVVSFGSCSLTGGNTVGALWACFAAGGSLSITIGAAGNVFIEGAAVGITGTSACGSGGFDPNSSFPAAATSGALTGLATNNPRDLVLAMNRNGGGETTPAGWTNAISGTPPNFANLYYKTFTSTQSGLTAPDVTGGNSGFIATALSAP